MNKKLRNFILTAKACTILYFGSIYAINHYFKSIEKDSKQKIETALEKTVDSKEFKKFQEEYQSQTKETQKKEQGVHRALNYLDSIIYLFE